VDILAWWKTQEPVLPLLGEIARKYCLYKKFVRKMLMKLTPVGLSLKPLPGIERGQK